MIDPRLAPRPSCWLAGALALAGCTTPEPPATTAAPVIATCEGSELQPAAPIAIGVRDLGGALAARGIVLAAGRDVSSSNQRHGALRGYLAIGDAWTLLPDPGGFYTLLGGETTDAFDQIVGTPAVAFDHGGTSAVVAYARRSTLAPFPYQVVVQILSPVVGGFDAEVVTSGVAPFVAGGTLVPKVSVAIDGGVVVVGWSWLVPPFDLAALQGSGLPDGGAVVYQIETAGGPPAFGPPHLLPATAPGPTFGDRVTIRGGMIAVSRPGPAQGVGPTVALYRSAGAAWTIDQELTSPTTDFVRTFAGILDHDHVVIAEGPLLPGETGAPAAIFERGPGGFAAAGALPTTSATEEVVRSIDARGDRVALGTAGTGGATFSVRVYRWQPGTNLVGLEGEVFRPDQADAVVALDGDRIVVGRASAEDSSEHHIEIWPLADLEAVDDAYTTPSGELLVTVSTNGLTANDALHCVVPDVVIDAPPLHGTLVMDLDGSFGYLGTATPFACGDRFRYHLEDLDSVSEEATVTIRFEGETCQRFVWEAYDQKPYFYKGCPDPGPEPWQDLPVITAASGRQIVDVELASDAALDVAVTSAPRNGTIVTSPSGFAFVPFAGASRDRVGLRVSSGACVYELEAELVVER